MDMRIDGYEVQRVANMVAFAAKNGEGIKRIFGDEEEFDYAVLELLELEGKIKHFSEFEIQGGGGYLFFSGEFQTEYEAIEDALYSIMENFREVFHNKASEVEDGLAKIGFTLYNLYEYHDGRIEPDHLKPYFYV